MLVTYPDARNLSASPGGTYGRCTSLGALHQFGSITPLGKWCNTPLSGVTPLRNKLKRGRCRAGTLLIQAATPVGGGEAWPGFEIDHSEPKARVWLFERAGRRPRAHQAAGPSKANPSGARKTAGAHSNKHNNGGASLPERPSPQPATAWHPRS